MDSLLNHYKVEFLQFFPSPCYLLVHQVNLNIQSIMSQANQVRYSPNFQENFVRVSQDDQTYQRYRKAPNVQWGLKAMQLFKWSFWHPQGASSAQIVFYKESLIFILNEEAFHQICLWTFLVAECQKAFFHCSFEPQGATSAQNVFCKEFLNFDAEQLCCSLHFVWAFLVDEDYKAF